MNDLFFLAVIIILILEVDYKLKFVALILLFLSYVSKPKATNEVKFSLCQMCDEAPDDAFNTYNISQKTDNCKNNYRASKEYDDLAMDQISQVYSDKKTHDIDDLGARRQVVQQNRARESIENRARVNTNSFRAYFGEEQETAENLSWWNIDQAIL